MEVILDPKKWDRGNSDGSLLGENGMCCLGFLGRKLGIEERYLRENAVPSCCDPITFDKWRGVGLIRYDRYEGETNSKLCNYLASINDTCGDDVDTPITDKERVKKLNSMLSKFKSKIRFKLKGK